MTCIAKLRGEIARAILSEIQAAIARLPAGGRLKTMTFVGSEGDAYLTRATIPVLLGCRLVIHRIHRGDEDAHPHNHPWAWARFLIASGGYDDERWTLDEDRDPPWQATRARLRPGDVNVLSCRDYHRVTDVLSGTTTVGLVGRDVQDWGFMIPDGLGRHVPYREYLRAKEIGRYLRARGIG